MDWKISEGANSGIMYHVLETHDVLYATGPEYQFVDDNGYEGKLQAGTSQCIATLFNPLVKLLPFLNPHINNLSHVQIMLYGDCIPFYRLLESGLV